MHGHAAERTRDPAHDQAGPAQARRPGPTHALALALALAMLLTFEGPRPALARMAMAARSCGFRAAQVAGDETGDARLVIPTDDGGDGIKARCVLRWFNTHPRLDLRVSQATVG